MTETSSFARDTDHLSSRTARISSTGAVNEVISYSTWGVSSSPNAAYTGKRPDASGRYYYFNARYYDPMMGRFLAEDPSRQGSGWYGYCNDDPVNRVDSNGRDVSNPMANGFGFYGGTSWVRDTSNTPFLVPFTTAWADAIMSGTPSFISDYGFWWAQNFNSQSRALAPYELSQTVLNLIAAGICVGAVTRDTTAAWVGKAAIGQERLAMLAGSADAAENTTFRWNPFFWKMSDKGGLHLGLEIIAENPAFTSDLRGNLLDKYPNQIRWNIFHFGTASLAGSLSDDATFGGIVSRGDMNYGIPFLDSNHLAFGGQDNFFGNFHLMWSWGLGLRTPGFRAYIPPLTDNDELWQIGAFPRWVSGD